MQALGKPQAAIGPVADAVDQLVGVADTKSREHDAALVGTAVAVGVAQVHEPIEITDVDAAVTWLDALHHRQPLGEFPRLVGAAVPVAVFTVRG